MRDERLRSPERAEHDRVAHVGRRHVERAQLGLEMLWIVDERQKVGERDQLAIVEARTDKLA